MTRAESHHLSIAALAAALALATPQLAVAQATPPPAPAATSDEATQLEAIEVTGSRIKRTDYETASPIQILSREDIEKTGRANIGDVLRGLSVDNQGTIPTAFTTGFAAGSSAVSLRGLGVNSTLVLVNGRRMATYGLADDGSRTFVDLNSIPLEAVERIEVLKDGASALYGSDAIGGVVNVILRKNYEGAALGTSQGISSRGDGNMSRYFGSVGFGNMARDKWNGFVSFESYNSNAIGNSDREGTLATNDWRAFGGFDNRNGASPQGFAGVLGSSNSPYGTINSPTAGFVNLTPCPETSPDTGLCVWDPIEFEQIQPDEDRQNFMARFAAEVGPVRPYLELSQFKTETYSLGTPGSWTFGNTYNAATRSIVPVFRATLAPNHPDNPTSDQDADGLPDNDLEGDGLSHPYGLRYLGADGGGRNQRTDNKLNRYLLGAEGDVEVWDNALLSWDVGILHVKSELVNTNYGFAHRSGVVAYLNGTGGSAAAATADAYRLNQVGANSAAAMEAIYHADTTNNSSEVSVIDGHVALPLLQLPGGPLTVVLGAERRNEKTDSPPVPGTDNGEVAGLGYSTYKSDRDVTAIYTEVGVPVHSMVEVTGAIRFDKYSDYGNSTTPKLGVKVKPLDELALRATYSEAFRAPGPAESGDAASFGFTPAFALLSIGNPAVQPETAKSYTLGFVAEPMDGTNLSVDYYLIQRENEIVQADSALIVGGAPACAAPGTVLPGAQPGSFIYYSTAAGGGGCGAQAPIGAVGAPYVNANETETSGIDLDLRHRFDVTDLGRLTASLVWTHLIKFERDVGGTTFEYAGTHGPYVLSSAGGTPKDRGVLSLGLERGAWNTTVNANYFGKMKMIDHENQQLVSEGGGFYNSDGGDIPIGYFVQPGQPSCGYYQADGKALNDCELDAWVTLDLVSKFAATQQWTASFAVTNLLDEDAPWDPYTYGGVGYHPANYQDGAVGRFYTVGLKYDFQ